MVIIKEDIENLETIREVDLEFLIELIKNLYGFDFNEYSRASFKRRVVRILTRERMSFFDLCNTLTNDLNYFEHFISEITVNVTEMFRDASFYKSISENIIPYLSTYQHIKVWNAGCSTGEELYSFVILFEEQNLYKRCFFYGTDINSKALDVAKNGIYDLKKLELYKNNFKELGSVNPFSKYFTEKYNAATIKREFKKNVLFSSHNLVSDGPFNEFQIISCRNVLIYFNSELQKKVLNLFYNSLANLGFLCLGSKEIIRDPALLKKLKHIDTKNNIYQKIG